MLVMGHLREQLKGREWVVDLARLLGRDWELWWVCVMANGLAQQLVHDSVQQLVVDLVQQSNVVHCLVIH